MIAITVPARTNSPSCSFFHSDILAPSPLQEGYCPRADTIIKTYFDRRRRTVEQYFLALWEPGAWSEFKDCFSLGFLFFQFRMFLRLVAGLTGVVMLVVIAFLIHSALVAHRKFPLAYRASWS